ncbi:MAG: VCBS repeat-containing protein [Candidatus Aminicenantes bacterium]|jgi:hypothetical protein
MKVLKKIKTFHILIILVCGISFIGKGIPLFGDDYVKVWDSGNIISNPIFDVAVGDTDKDGKPEIVAADICLSGGAKVYVFENTGDNSYQLVWDSGTAFSWRISRVAIGDQDSDGNLEIIATESHNLPPHGAKIHVFENIGDNDYQEVWHSGSDLNGMEITSNFLGDADNDGKREIIIGAGYHWSNCKLRVYENTGDNAFQEVWNSGNTTGDSVAEGTVGDTDGDGKMEIIVGSGGIEKVVRVFENIGDNSYDLVTKISGFGKSPQAVIGDQDKDGSMEIIVGSHEGEWAVRVFEHTGFIGDNTYTEVWGSGTLDGRIYQPATGDQDHDGKREIIAPCVDGCKVYLFENIGDNDYREVWNSGNVIGGLIQYVATGDQDKDGKGEIIIPSYDGKIYVFEHNVLELAVPFDIKPKSCPNPLNVKNQGMLPAAILGTGDFDVTTIDIASIRLEGVAPIRTAFEDVTTPFEPYIGKMNKYDCTTEGPDGFIDLTLKFDTGEVVQAIGQVTDGDVMVLELSGNLLEEFGGTPIKGEDVVVILKKKKK